MKCQIQKICNKIQSNSVTDYKESHSVDQRREIYTWTQKTADGTEPSARNCISDCLDIVKQFDVVGWPSTRDHQHSMAWGKTKEDRDPGNRRLATGAAEGDDIPEEEWTDGPVQPPVKKGRKLHKPSPAWPFFQVRGKVNKERAEFVRCKFRNCQWVIRRGDLSKGGRALTTTGMLSHLFRHHWRESDRRFRALTRKSKRMLCGPGTDTSGDEALPTMGSSDEDPPTDSAKSATNPAPTGPPSAPVPGILAVMIGRYPRIKLSRVDEKPFATDSQESLEAGTNRRLATSAAEGDDIPEEEWTDFPVQPPFKKGRKLRKSSPAWPFFQVRGKINKERAEFVRCKFQNCQWVIRRGDLSKCGRALTTTGMLSHLFRHHWRETDRRFRALTRKSKRMLCGPGTDTSEDEALPTMDSSGEDSLPDSAESATNPAPAGPPSAPVPGICNKIQSNCITDYKESHLVDQRREICTWTQEKTAEGTEPSARKRTSDSLDIVNKFDVVDWPSTRDHQYSMVWGKTKEGSDPLAKDHKDDKEEETSSMDRPVSLNVVKSEVKDETTANDHDDSILIIKHEEGEAASAMDHQIFMNEEKIDIVDWPSAPDHGHSSQGMKEGEAQPPMDHQDLILKEVKIEEEKITNRETRTLITVSRDYEKPFATDSQESLEAGNSRRLATGAAEGDEIPEEVWTDDFIQPPLKKGRKLHKSSPAWPFFQVRGNVNKERAEFVRCKFQNCQRVIRRGDLTKPGRALTTTGMLSHLFRHHWRETDRAFRALTRKSKHVLCGPDTDTSEDEALPTMDSSDEGSPPDSAESATNPAPTGPPSAPVQGYVMVRDVRMDLGFFICATCGQSIAPREPSIAQLAEAVAQHICAPRR